ncbi:MAG: hypothetical protein ACMUEM_01735 [Flavobacteriales bacterium AspAUS03]
MEELRISEAKLNQTRSNTKHYKNLWVYNVIEKIKLDHALSEVKADQTQVDADRATINKIKKDFYHV